MPARRKVTDEIAADLVARYLAGDRIISLGAPYGYDYKTVRRVLVDHGVEIRKTGGPRKPPPAPLEDILAWHQAGESCHQIAQRLGTYSTKISNALRDAGHEPADGRSRRGSASPIFRTGRLINKEGYVTVILDPHEYRLKGSRGGNTMLEHRLVMARRLGRALYDYETVHHINGIRSDNSPENLELWVVGQPPGQRQGEAPARKHCPTCTCCMESDGSNP